MNKRGQRAYEKHYIKGRCARRLGVKSGKHLRERHYKGERQGHRS
jgi:hypothetical protein